MSINNNTYISESGTVAECLTSCALPVDFLSNLTGRVGMPDSECVYVRIGSEAAVKATVVKLYKKVLGYAFIALY